MYNLCSTCSKKKNGTYGFICRPLGIRVEPDFGCIQHSANCPVETKLSPAFAREVLFHRDGSRVTSDANGLLFYSKDGVKWSLVFNHPTEDCPLRFVFYGDGNRRFVWSRDVVLIQRKGDTKWEFEQGGELFDTDARVDVSDGQECGEPHTPHDDGEENDYTHIVRRACHRA